MCFHYIDFYQKCVCVYGFFAIDYTIHVVVVTSSPLVSPFGLILSANSLVAGLCMRHREAVEREGAISSKAVANNCC